MKKLNLPVSSAEVWKTGLPFYDAAWLIGAAHRHFGTATVEVQDNGLMWRLSGPSVKERQGQQRMWVMDGGLPAFAPSVKNLRSAIETVVINPNENAAQDASGKRKGKKAESAVYYYLESALQTGIRGPDPLASYRNLASQAGTEFSQPLQDVADAALGISFAAVSRGGRNDAGEFRVLPVVAGKRLVLGPFLDFRRTYQHEAGGFVAAVWASLALMEDLIAQDMPIVDFAYNWVVPRVQSTSGYIGVDRVCTLTRRRKDKGKDFHFAQQVRRYLAQTAWQGNTAEQDMARALSYFTTTADVKHLETIVRLKARLMAQDESGQGRSAIIRARRLFTYDAIEEVADMTETSKNDIPWGMINALAKWFTSGGKDGWIGQFIKLENASSPERFLDVAEHILSRARMHKENPVSYSAPREEQEKLQKIRSLSTTDFRGLRAVFLLDVQARMTTGA